MNRDEEVQKIGKRIQYQINKLKKLNCTIDMSYNTLSIFDNTKKAPIDRYDNGVPELDYSEQMVYDFNLDREC